VNTSIAGKVDHAADARFWASLNASGVPAIFFMKNNTIVILVYRMKLTARGDRANNRGRQTDAAQVG